MKKLLMLGGAWAQVPAIKRAKELGYYVITCDYLPNNPGHAYSDEYQNISTVNIDDILRYAVEERIDGIIAYASDPSAVAAGHVCDKLKIPGASYKAVKLLCEKDIFRQFQKEHGFNVPEFLCIGDVEEAKECFEKINFPIVVKPVDSSGSKGVCVIENKEQLEQAVVSAMNYSRCGRVIIEEYIDSPYCQLHGDGVVYNGQVVFLALGDQRFRSSVPIGTSFPSNVDEKILKKAYKEVEKLIQYSRFSCGGINVEIRVTADGEVYIIEIGPRTGGNYIPQLMQLATGEDEMTEVLKIAMEDQCDIRFPSTIQPSFQYIIGSEQSGMFERIFVDEYIKEKVVDLFIHKKVGDYVDEYINSNGVVGVAIMKFNNKQEMEEDIKYIKEHIKVIVKKTTI